VVSYNVENLFHPSDNPQMQDDEFTPAGARRWTFTRYRRKLNAVSKAIIACAHPYLPALVGLVEVEDDSVLTDLTRTGTMRKAGYRYVMTHGDDLRGINVALLYQRDRFRLLAQQDIRLEGLRTRNLLHVSGQLPTGDTLDVCVVHFPSRRGGERESEPLRMKAAQRLKRLTDSISQVRAKPYIMVMGDFNDHAYNRSLQLLTHEGLSNLSTTLPQGGIGTYKWEGDWEVIDHILVSNTLLNAAASPLRITSDDLEVAHFPFLLERDTKAGGMRPRRTFYGFTYQSAGTSDHLPLVLHSQLQLTKNP
jgi:predicted extracellular nuclease